MATLDSTGKIPQGQLPAIAIKETFPVKSEAEMLALTAQEGDMAIRSDLRKSFVLMRQPASTLANWQELLTPTDAVSSVNGQRGNVVLEATDVGAEPAFEKKTAFNKDFGTAANTVMQGNDSRVVNAVPKTRTINGHALSANVELTAEDVGALDAGATAVNAAKLENTTKSQIISQARSGLAASGASYTKAESDGKYATKDSLGASIKDAIRTVDITVESASTTVLCQRVQSQQSLF
ncbi:phage tail fiber protein [Vibrio sp. JCM 18904]|nr:phage tail fiber protein [Vibrio sp. JCM 18904]